MPLEEIATAAGVSKATIYNRFGGREGLIDAVIGELVATEMHAIMDKARQLDDPWRAIATYTAIGAICSIANPPSLTRS
jgi:AcrR family transcriptional regulator